METFTVQLTFTGDAALDARTIFDAFKRAASKHENCFGEDTTGGEYAAQLSEKLIDEAVTTLEG